MFYFNKEILILISLTLVSYVKSDGKRFFSFQNIDFHVEEYPDNGDQYPDSTTEAYPDYNAEPTTEEQYPDYQGDSTTEEQYPDYNGDSTTGKNPDTGDNYGSDNYGGDNNDNYGDDNYGGDNYGDDNDDNYGGDNNGGDNYGDDNYGDDNYGDDNNGGDNYGDDNYGDDNDDNNEGDNDNNAGNWGECSRSCGIGTQTRNPTRSASDFRDCKIRDCPRESCSAPFHRRYGLRSHSCCDVTPLLSGGGVCGASSTQAGVGNLIGRIVGGVKSAPKRFPWMAGILVDGKQHCGGVLIDSDWILTAAHCFVYDGGETQDLSAVKIMFGTIDLTDTVGTNQNLQISGVNKLVYKDYKFPQNDIALLRLTKPPRFTDYVQPICLPEGEILPDEANCVAAGWGDKKNSGKNENIMDEVQIRLLPDDLCEKAYGGRFFKNMMKCAGKIEGGIDTCQGDSGGPLMCQRCASCQWVTYGVVSFGDGCALKHSPGVYVQVNNYADWIRSVTGLQSSGKTHEQCSKL